MTTHGSIENQLIFHEGMELKPYRCTAEKLSIGAGRNLDDKGITEEEALYLLHNDIAECRLDLVSIFPFFPGFSVGRQWALIDLRFNLGPSRFRGFKKMIAAIKSDEWLLAGFELKNSTWWDQVQPDRRDTIYRQIMTGEK